MRSIHKVYIFLIFIFCGCHKKIDLLSTKKFIDKAETEIILYRLPRANSYYKKAFKSQESWFLIDYFNALYISISERDRSFATKIIKRLKALGICESYFANIKEIKNDTFLYKISQLPIPLASSIDLKYKKEIEILLNDDQACRPLTSLNSSIVAKVDSTNFEKFKNLITKYQSFPSERRIGRFCDGGGVIEPIGYTALIRHFCQRKFTGIDSILKSALRNSDISNEEYASFIDLMNINERYYSSPIYVINELNYTWKLSDSAMNKVNSDRMSIGMFSMEEALVRKKRDYENRNQRFRVTLCPYCPLENLGQFEKPLLDKILKNFEKIDLN